MNVAAALPGMVMQVCKSTGDEVLKGEPLPVCEYMKMENEILSPADGKLAKVHVRTGYWIGVNEKLVDIAAVVI